MITYKTLCCQNHFGI